MQASDHRTTGCLGCINENHGEIQNWEQVTCKVLVITGWHCNTPMTNTRLDEEYVYPFSSDNNYGDDLKCLVFNFASFNQSGLPCAAV